MSVTRIVAVCGAVLLLAALASVLLACKRQGDRELAERHLGVDTICNYHKGRELACITATGRRYLCATRDGMVNCTVAPAPEAP